MKKASSLLVPALLLGLSAAIVQSCASGETDPAFVGPGGSGGDDGSGDGDGGVSGDGSGGKTGSGGSNGSSGGAAASSGGATGTASGGAKSGGATGTASGGVKGSGGSGGVKSGGTTGTASGGKVGSGGTTTTTASGGTTTPVGTGGTVATSCTGTNAAAMNGYIMTSTWMGYSFTLKSGTGTTVTPDCSTSTAACYATAGSQVCAMGTVAADTTYAAVAGWGWNIDQVMTGSNPPATAIAPMGTGLSVNIPGATADMRLQLSDGAATETTWCASMPANGTGTVPWASFTKTCYDTTKGDPYSMTTKIAKIEVIVPSKSATSTPFCFCVVSIAAGG